VTRLPIEIHPAAAREAAAARRWYAERNEAVADAFVSAMEHAVDRIQDSPTRYAEYLHGTRRFILERFPFLMIYRILPNRIQIVAVAHGRRRPGYWVKRS